VISSDMLQFSRALVPLCLVRCHRFKFGRSIDAYIFRTLPFPHPFSVQELYGLSNFLHPFMSESGYPIGLSSFPFLAVFL